MTSYHKKNIEDIDVSGKRVLVRCDFNVPIAEGKIQNDTRIQAALPTIRYLMAHHARVILCSHLGRPKGKVDPQYSLAPVAVRLSELLGVEVKMAKDVVGESAQSLAAGLQDGEVMLLENVRFHKEETDNDPAFAKELASLAEIYVNDAFGTAHRAHASTAGVAAYLPAVCGYLIEKEIRFMGGALENPKRPFVAILGGAKVSDKIGVIRNLISKVDTLLIGGGMSYPIKKAYGKEVGHSMIEGDETVPMAAEIIKEAEEKGVRLVIPIDQRVCKEVSKEAEAIVVDEIPADMTSMDIGPKTEALFAEIIKDAATIIWNGPVGAFEFPQFSHGTFAVAKAVAASDAVSIIGGGDSISAVTQSGVADKITHISTGGGATLEFLEGIELPGIAALNDK